MKIWLVNPYGPIPGEGWRDYSFTMIGEALSKDGHEVVWVTSNFSHHFKKFRSASWSEIVVNEKFKIVLVPTTGYKKNIGVGRILRDAVFAARAYFYGRKQGAPDCILTAESPLTFGFAGAALAKFHKAALVYDQMDLWPELMVNAFPSMLRPLVNALFYPVYWYRRRMYRSLDGAMALAKPYLEVVLKEAPVLRGKPHDTIYNGIDVLGFRTAANSDVVDVCLPVKNSNEVWVIFAGSLGPSYDISTMVAAGRFFESINLPIKIFIAGDGPLRELVEQASAVCGNLEYLGKVSPEKLAYIYGVCDIGVCAYSSRSNVEMPDKFYDYTAAGLAILNSLRGEVSRQIEDRQLGLQYVAGDCVDLCKKISFLAADRELLLKMRNNSFNAGMDFDRHVQYGRLTKFIEAAVEGKV